MVHNLRFINYFLLNFITISSKNCKQTYQGTNICLYYYRKTNFYVTSNSISILYKTFVSVLIVLCNFNIIIILMFFYILKTYGHTFKNIIDLNVTNYFIGYMKITDFHKEPPRRCLSCLLEISEIFIYKDSAFVSHRLNED